MKTNRYLQVIASLLILLFIYTAMSKLMDFHGFKIQMYSQTLPKSIATTLIWSLPEIEITTAILLLFDRTRIMGFQIATILMMLFTGYVTLVLLNYFGRIPCSCGGIIKDLGWKIHLFINLFFLLLSYLGIFLTYRERRLVGD